MRLPAGCRLRISPPEGRKGEQDINVVRPATMEKKQESKLGKRCPGDSVPVSTYLPDEKGRESRGENVAINSSDDKRHKKERRHLANS